MRTGRAVGLLLGVAADAVFGDPRRGHPVAFFGRMAQSLEKVLYQERRGAGVAYTAVLVGGTVTAGALAERFARRSPVLEALMTGAVTWAVLGGTSLASEGTAMAQLLADADITAARERLGNLCGRNAAELDASGLARATVESMAENTSDAVVAPLVWGAIAGIPGLAGYRAANTLDAMVGHPNARYREFGWASARLDDLLNLLPARLAAAVTALCAPAVDGSTERAWRTWWRDADAHPSPNAGQVEAAFAGALGVRLGGRTSYGELVEQRPVMGDGRDVEVADVTRSITLARQVAIASTVLSCVVALGRSR